MNVRYDQCHRFSVYLTHPEPDISSSLVQRINSTHYFLREAPIVTTPVDYLTDVIAKQQKRK
jgi:hypothetical protein